MQPFFTVFGLLLAASAAGAAGPLHQQIDAIILVKAKGHAAAPLADDAEFVRRVYLDFAGRIPTGDETRAFLADAAPDKRARLIDKLLASPEYVRRMADAFHVMLMERLGDHPEWTQYLEASFAANKPWDQMTREMLRASADDPATRGAAFFLSKRLENFGQNPVDYPGLTRDVGRLFLGKDLQCAQCHDHLFIGEYKQHDFQGLFAFFQNVSRRADVLYPAVAEKPTTKKLEFMSVFRKVQRETGPRLPGGKEIALPAFKPGEEYLVPPDRKTRAPGVPRFSLLAAISEELPRPENEAFARNIVNRLWWLMMGRGLVEPLDLHHRGNEPSHPELLALLAREFTAHKYDIKWLLRELALSETYQRSSMMPQGDRPPPEKFLVAHEKRLSAEQLLWSMLTATGEKERVTAAGNDPKKPGSLEAARAKFLRAFANQAREPEESFAPSLKAALFLLNDDLVQDWLTPRPGNLLDAAAKEDDAKAVAELYLRILSRKPSEIEAAEAKAYLAKNAARRSAALKNLAWALLASTEFCVNH